jgi:hypothetical protein
MINFNNDIKIDLIKKIILLDNNTINNYDKIINTDYSQSNNNQKESLINTIFIIDNILTSNINKFFNLDGSINAFVEDNLIIDIRQILLYVINLILDKYKNSIINSIDEYNYFNNIIKYGLCLLDLNINNNHDNITKLINQIFNYHNKDYNIHFNKYIKLLL